MTTPTAPAREPLLPWRDPATMPTEGAYLVRNGRREVCPCHARDGYRTIQNMVGFADWTYGEPITGWMPFPSPDERAPAAVPPADGGVAAIASRITLLREIVAGMRAMADGDAKQAAEVSLKLAPWITMMEERTRVCARVVDEWIYGTIAAIPSPAVAPAPADWRDGGASEWLVWSNYHQAWWRENEAGYTIHLESAGRYSRDDAVSISRGARDGYHGDEPPTEIPVRLADMLPMVRERIRALAPPAVAPPPTNDSGWRDISTAPKDGETWIWAFWPDYSPPDQQCPTIWDDAGDRWLDNAEHREFQQPTHWRPLLAPPAVAPPGADGDGGG